MFNSLFPLDVLTQLSYPCTSISLDMPTSKSQPHVSTRDTVCAMLSHNEDEAFEITREMPRSHNFDEVKSGTGYQIFHKSREFTRGQRACKLDSLHLQHFHNASAIALETKASNVPIDNERSRRREQSSQRRGYGGQNQHCIFSNNIEEYPFVAQCYPERTARLICCACVPESLKNLIDTQGSQMILETKTTGKRRPNIVSFSQARKVKKYL